MIVDDTSSPAFLRDAWRALAQQLGVGLALVHLDVAPEVSLERHAANRNAPSRADVSDAILAEHLQNFEAPTDQEHPIRYTGESSELVGVLDQVHRRFRGSDRGVRPGDGSAGRTVSDAV